jgi:uncharacterized protein (DUF983 family)
MAAMPQDAMDAPSHSEDVRPESDTAPGSDVAPGSNGVPGRGLFLSRVLRRRCPQCGEGPLFTSYAKLAQTCSVCELRFRRESGSMTGSMYLSAAVTQVFAVLLLLVWIFWTDWSASFFLWLAMPLVFAACVAFLPISMCLWVAVEYTVDVSNGEDWARPRL